MVSVTPHLSSLELERRYKSERQRVAKSHFHAIWLLSLGHENVEVAEVMGFSPRWVSSLLKRYNLGGPAALGDQRAHNGTDPTILTPSALSALRERITSPPDDGGVWSAPKVAHWLAKFHRMISVHDQRGWDALIAIEYAIQKPRPRHPEAATPVERQRLKKTATCGGRGTAQISASRH